MGKPSTSSTRFLPKGLVILYEDRDILVVDKPAGLLTIATDKAKSDTAYFMLTDYVRKGQSKSRNRLFIVHRLDRETTGILVFAKNKGAKLFLQGHWKKTEKKYLAVVHGKLEKSSDTITSYLAENAAHIVYSTTDTKKGKLSRTAYKVLRERKGVSLLEVSPLTGRKNQIRVHLAGIGHPVVGDKKYGKKDKSHPRLALHARSISFKHPFSGKRLSFEAQVPAYFERLVGPMDREESPPRPSTTSPPSR
jgi:23S rRNA pseudouridine1911/1915/1917 synthase